MHTYFFLKVFKKEPNLEGEENTTKKALQKLLNAYPLIVNQLSQILGNAKGRFDTSGLVRVRGDGKVSGMTVDQIEVHVPLLVRLLIFSQHHTCASSKGNAKSEVRHVWGDSGEGKRES